MVTIKSGDIEKTIRIIQILSNKTSKLLDNLPSEPQKLWEELRNEISYQYDEDGLEQIRSIEDTFNEKMADCEDFCIVISSKLHSINVPHYYRLYDFGNGGWEHIAIVLKSSGVVIDCVSNIFNRNPKCVKFKDIKAEKMQLLFDFKNSNLGKLQENPMSKNQKFEILANSLKKYFLDSKDYMREYASLVNKSENFISATNGQLLFYLKKGEQNRELFDIPNTLYNPFMKQYFSSNDFKYPDVESVLNADTDFDSVRVNVKTLYESVSRLNTSKYSMILMVFLKDRIILKEREVNVDIESIEEFDSLSTEEIKENQSHNGTYIAVRARLLLSLLKFYISQKINEIVLSISNNKQKPIVIKHNLKIGDSIVLFMPIYINKDSIKLISDFIKNNDANQSIESIDESDTKAKKLKLAKAKLRLARIRLELQLVLN